MMLPKFVRIVEVGPRDGLQNEAAIVATEDKIRLIDMLSEAGFSEIEVSSFVRPDRIPQLSDAVEVFARIKQMPGVRYSALVPNKKGLDRAIKAGVKSVALFTAASETFSVNNTGLTVKESLSSFRELITEARIHNIRVRAYISTAFACPYEGVIHGEKVRELVAKIVEMDVDEISIGDTIGYALPDDVKRLTETLLPVLPVQRFAYHFHDTRNHAIENVEAALEYSVSCFDSAIGGLGGCPFAPGAPGNLATESLLAFLQNRGIETNVSLEKTVAASGFLKSLI